MCSTGLRWRYTSRPSGSGATRLSRYRDSNLCVFGYTPADAVPAIEIDNDSSLHKRSALP